MSKFNLKDRVAVYTSSGRHVARVVSIAVDGSLGCINEPRGTTIIFWHPKQCRKLIKRERRRVWIQSVYLPTGVSGTNIYVSAGEMVGPEWTEFVEVKRK